MSGPAALGAHVYAGGHTLGARAAGFDVVAHLEEGIFGTETAQRELGVEVRVGMESWRPRDYAGVSYLFSNPPCASFSRAGSNEVRWHVDGRTDHTRRVFDLLPVVRPEVFSWECVANATVQGRDFVRERARRVTDLGYDAHVVLFDAADLGLPSYRKRMFFVASRVELEFEAPAHPRVTLREALAGLDPGPLTRISEFREAVLAKMPAGAKAKLADYSHLVRMSTRAGRPYGKPGFMHCRCAWDRPAPTVTGGCHLYHPSEARALTVREVQVLLGYPVDYRFTGGSSTQYAEAAKAVTPTAARWLGQTVCRGLECGKRSRGGRVMLHNHIREGQRFMTEWAS